MSALAAAVAAAGWCARIALGFERRGSRTVLARRHHEGPLVVQSPLYPEGATSHVYLLHPPGGVVGGDDLSVEVTVDSGAEALITTPAAGKFYRAGGRIAVLRQHLAVAAGATLEWLPQETIFFDGAEAVLETRVDLESGARFIGHEVLCLGRPAAGERLGHGVVKPAFEVWRDGAPMLLERAAFAGGARTLDEPWGLGGHPVFGTLVATPCAESELDAVRPLAGPDGETPFAATLLDDLLVCRALGKRADRVRTALEGAWAVLRPLMLERPACPPRVWRT